VALAVERYELGPIGTNGYLVRAHDAATDAVVIDPGAEADRLLRSLEDRETHCAAILITHGHWDHLGGVADLAEATGAPVYMAEDERVLLEDVNSFTPPGVELRPYVSDVGLNGDETLEFAGSVGRTDLPGADWETLVDSIRMLADRFPPGTVVYPGHGNQTTLGAEVARNPFLAELRA
jgi:hydroxyacylglutathione hydrolase